MFQGILLHPGSFWAACQFAQADARRSVSSDVIPAFFQYLCLQQSETLFLLFEDVGNRFQLAFIADRVND